MSRKKRNTKRARTLYCCNHLYLIAHSNDVWRYNNMRRPEDPWYHIPFEDLVKTLKIWRDAFQTIPIQQYVEMTLGSPKPKKYGDELPSGDVS